MSQYDHWKAHAAPIFALVLFFIIVAAVLIWMK